MRFFGLFARNDKRLRLNDGSWKLNSRLMNTAGKRDAWLRTLDRYEYRVGSRIGDNSVFGTVHSFEPTRKVDATSRLSLYVLKRVAITKNNKHMMDRIIYEAVFGETFVDAPIPVVVAHRFDKNTGVYEILMQNILKTTAERDRCASSSLDAYYRKHPDQDKRTLRKVHDTIVEFYKRTKHFHGDLHLANLMVTYDKRAPHALSKVFVIDFGSSMPFLRTDWPRIDRMKRLHQFEGAITDAFSNLHERQNFNSKEHSTVFGPLVWLKHGGAVLHNLKQVQHAEFWDKILTHSRKNTKFKNTA